jgi:excisionase family DNA binding protein
MPPKRRATESPLSPKVTPLQDEFLDVAETANFLKVRPATVYMWVHKKLIPHRKHGNRLAFSKYELCAWSASRAVSANDAA